MVTGKLPGAVHTPSQAAAAIAAGFGRVPR